MRKALRHSRKSKPDSGTPFGHGMAGGQDNGGKPYGQVYALIYVFNLVVGTGVLALPAVLTSGGWVLGASFMCLVAFLSFIGVTFVVEAMAAANYVYKKRFADVPLSAAERVPLVGGEGPEVAEAPSPGAPEGSLFDITRKTEMSEMAEMFFGRGQTGHILFYIALVVYLFGDAAIYCTFVPRSLVGFFWPENPPAWAFDLFLVLFVVCIFPICFSKDFQGRGVRYLQLTTLGVRQAALFMIIALATWTVLKTGTHSEGVPNFRVKAIPNLFGGAVYAFMCHHSLPGIITPLQDKTRLTGILGAAFSAIFAIYVLLFVTCGLAFGINVKDPITFNFSPAKFGFIGNFLLLFPVFTLSSSFPMIAITLRNNLRDLLDLFNSEEFSGRRPSSDVEHSLVRGPGSSSPGGEEGGHVPPPGGPKGGSAWTDFRGSMMTLLAVVPPLMFCVIAEHLKVDVNELVGITGAFAGSAVMFIIPACLAYKARKKIGDAHNKHASPFRGTLWVVVLVVWALTAMVFNFYEKYIQVEKP